MSLINSFTHIQANWKFVIICVQNQWGVVHPWHGTVANLWGRHKEFTEFNENFEKSYLLNGLSNIVKFFTVWFLKIFCIKWIHIFFWVQCSFKPIADDLTLLYHTFLIDPSPSVLGTSLQRVKQVKRLIWLHMTTSQLQAACLIQCSLSHNCR